MYPITMITCAGIIAFTLIAIVATAPRKVAFRAGIFGDGDDQQQTGLEYLIIFFGLILPCIPVSFGVADGSGWHVAATSAINGFLVIICQALCFSVWAAIVGRGTQWTRH